MPEPYETLDRPEGTVQEIQVVYGTMAQRYREAHPAINKPSQDTLPNRD